MTQAMLDAPDCEDAAVANARLCRPERAFDMGLPPVPVHVFAQERNRAFDGGTGTGMIALDLARQLKLPTPATTPVMLARYLVVKAADTLNHRFAACGEIFYVLRGIGISLWEKSTIRWKAGDVFCHPGGAQTIHTAATDAVLLCVTNEPELAWQGLQPPAREANPVEPAHFLGERIDEHIDLLQGPTKTAGRGILLVTPNLRNTMALLPSIAVAMNSLEPGADQRPHRHNAAALTLAIAGEDVSTLIDGVRHDWLPDAVLVTPPRATHSHHNRGAARMKSLVFQDSGLYYQYRNAGFQFDNAAG